MPCHAHPVLLQRKAVLGGGLWAPALLVDLALHLHCAGWASATPLELDLERMTADAVDSAVDTMRPISSG